jgi:hypothetical protein
VFLSGEGEDGGIGGVRGGRVGASDCVFHGVAHAFVVVFRACYVGTMPCVKGATTAGREEHVFGVE